MQTFLPFKSFTESAKCLDYKRLGKQRVECFQIFRALSDPNYGWQNHPAVKMWRGYEKSLLVYSIIICKEWRSRGYKDTMLDRFKILHKPFKAIPTIYPHWLGLKRFHASHRSNLLRKDSLFYSRYKWKEPSSLEYVWPVIQP
jgi:hypothetical protein